MDDFLEEVKKYWNSTSDSDWYRSLRTDDKIGKLVNEPASAFHPDVFAAIQRHIGSVEGKKILLPSSGDNHAAFAFALMGAEVTSADISERQLKNAERIAETLKMKIQFVCDDTMTLAKIKEGEYDAVFTSNGTLSWINDLSGMYENIGRVLRRGGYYFMYDLHPFNRPFSGKAWLPPEIVKSYHDVFPDLHWRVQDIINAGINAGLEIKEMAELPAVNATFWFSYEELIREKEEDLLFLNDWKKNPMAALPAWLLLVSKKTVNK